MKILNFGSANLDYVYSLDHIVVEGETEQSESMNIFAGGKGLNQSVAAARAGATIYHAGCIGNDGEILIKTLSESGVNTSLIKRENERNGHAIIQVSKNGENSIFIHSGTNAMIKKEYVDNVLSHFGKGDIIILQNEINLVGYIIDAAYKKEMFIILNPSPMNEKIFELDFSKISCLVANEAETKAIFKSDDFNSISRIAKRDYPGIKLMLTRGLDGSVYIDSDKIYNQNAFVVDVADTTAAGDSFMGYFVSGIVQKKDIREMLKIASAASAIAVSRPGAAPSIPYMQEVTEKIGLLEERCSQSDLESTQRQIKKYVINNIADVTLAKMAEEFNYSYYTMRNIIKMSTGKSFVRYVQDVRLNEAARLIRSTDMSISEITNAVGYENESFFRRKFKECYGVTPKDYKTEKKVK